MGMTLSCKCMSAFDTYAGVISRCPIIYMQVENLGFSVLCTHLTPDLQPNGLDYCKLLGIHMLVPV